MGNTEALRSGVGIFGEIISMVAIELLEPGSPSGFVQSGKPDRIDVKRGIGL